MRLIAALACLLAAAATGGSARAAQPVDLALALVTDVSRSVDDTEFELEKHGYETAFLNPQVLAAIRGGPLGAIAVAYIEFASAGEVRTVVDWTLVRDEASARAFVDQVRAAPRSFYGRTAIGAGIDRGVQAMAEMPFEPTRRVIDVCGDGTNNAGRDVEAARDDALAAGITVNGLAIINENPAAWTFAHVQPPGGLGNYYRNYVAGGPGSFVIEIHSFAAFGEAMTRKLINEIAVLQPAEDPARSRFAVLP